MARLRTALYLQRTRCHRCQICWNPLAADLTLKLSPTNLIESVCAASLTAGAQSASHCDATVCCAAADSSAWFVYVGTVTSSFPVIGLNEANRHNMVSLIKLN